ncbi:hypothetical protein VFPPC_10606 [Pochonia chlamydosporia 170]|uniref:Uncharacterized protein n=1 Tax=Pochonia chlamydosporia 170 TaxID=1380566 RepID=A0A179F442_METCM|nr:hypothetical protein VFPPC_10606 [Pochonia chlamydosporia 170]OAQ60176.1 hypothetical protein VFPPC_10606 [Pochonia chlamydosporia 170]
MSSSHSTTTLPSSRSTTPFTDLDTVVDEDWVKLNKAKSDASTRERESRMNNKQAVHSTISLSRSVDDCVQALGVCLSLTVHSKSINSSGSYWGDEYALTLRTNSPANHDFPSPASSPLGGSSWSQYNDRVKSHQENRPGVECEPIIQDSAEPAPGCAANPNPAESAAISENEVTEIKTTSVKSGKEIVIRVSRASILRQLGLPIMEIERVGDSAATAERRDADAEVRALNTVTLDAQSHLENQPGVEYESTAQCSTEPSLGYSINLTPVKPAAIDEDEMTRMIINDETGEFIGVYPADVVRRPS